MGLFCLFPKFGINIPQKIGTLWHYHFFWQCWMCLVYHLSRIWLWDVGWKEMLSFLTMSNHLSILGKLISRRISLFLCIEWRRRIDLDINHGLTTFFKIFLFCIYIFYSFPVTPVHILIYLPHSRSLSYCLR